MSEKVENYVSMVCSVYNSHDIFCRQLKYLRKELAGLDNCIECIFVDDGSNPPLKNVFDEETGGIKNWFDNFVLLSTDSKVPWNQPAGRNLGAKNAKGNYLLMFDLDHVITRWAVRELLYTKIDMMKWKRLYGILEEDKIITNKKTLMAYGLRDYVDHRQARGCNNTYGIKKSIYDAVGGYDEKYCGHYGGDDVDFFKRLRRFGTQGINGSSYIYDYPNPRANKSFHELHRTAGKVGRGNEQKV